MSEASNPKWEDWLTLYVDASWRDPDDAAWGAWLRYNQPPHRLIKGDVPDPLPPTRIGEAAVRREGDDVTLFSYGLMAHESLAAADQLAGEGLSCHVVDLRTLAPLDRPAIVDAARRPGRVLVVHEDHLTGGIGGEIAAIVAQQAFEYLDAPIMRVAGPDVPAMGYHANLEHAFMPNAERIAAGARELAAY